jgi:hypothetical protein
MPDEQPPPPPAPNFGMDAPAASMLEGMDLRDSAAFTLDMSFVREVSLQSGQDRPALPAPILCMTVKTVEHLLHLYSYIGIILPPALL